jgi:aryl-phospho-beta-D-glucosidase BglC (GH1 family)
MGNKSTKIKKIKTCSFVVVMVLMVTSFIPNSVGFAATANPADDYLHTSGNKILDDNGNEVRLTGIAWFGFETPNFSYHGLWANTLSNILDTVADNGFNLLRVPLSVELVNQWRQGIYPMPDSPNDYLNPDLKGMNSLQLLDASVDYSKKIGLKIMLDMHRIESGGQTPTWYTGDYTTEDFEACWTWLAEHYKTDDTVIAMDIFNEPHGKPYWKEEGAKWDSSTDANNWKYEVEKVGKLIQKVNPKLLIMVEGIEAYPKEGFTYAETNKDNYYGSWWGGNLRGVSKDPIILDANKNEIVYSPHDYGPSVSAQPWFEGDFNQDTLTKDVWRPNWFYIHENNTAPLLIGEWGGRMDGGVNQKWMSALASFIADNNISHTFWCINPNSGDTGGILGSDFKTVDTEKLALVEPTLWKDKDLNKYIGLDHEVNLGKSGTRVQSAVTIEPILKGDANGDGKINSIDYILMKKYLEESGITININNADLNNDKKIDVIDLIKLKNLLS